MADGLEKLIRRIEQYNPQTDLSEVVKAYHFGDEAHRGQLRNSGEKFFIHPVHVALILAELNMDTTTIVAGLLHDVIEDTSVTYEDVGNEFSFEIADLVEGVTKLKKIGYKTKQENQAENLRKMVLAMSEDIRVIIVKLADRLHNMRTLEYMTPEKKKEKALETLEIYAPLAHRLGISKIKWELEDLSLRYLKPDKYYDLVEKVSTRRKEREDYINKIIEMLYDNLGKADIESEISGRPKNFYSIYKKMEIRGKDFEEIFDLTAVRILVDNIKDCYGVLGIVHTLWKPIPRRFKDYIAMPKPNMYQSLHTTVMGDRGEIFEVQIRTYEMHKTAEYGIAAHWKYKEGISKTENFDEKLTWLRQLMEWQNDLKDPKDFMETLKIDFFTDEVFVFTPLGDIINLPEGSTPIDFAYRVHTDVGNTCVGAKIDGRLVPLNYKLENGNIVEIITSKNSSGPSRDWLKIVKSTQAKSKIKQWFKHKNRDIDKVKGKEILERELKRQNYKLNEILKDEWLEEIVENYSLNSIEDLYASIGYGNVKYNHVITKLRENYEKTDEFKVKKEKELEQEVIKNTKGSEKNKKKSYNGVSVKDLDNIKTRISKCCNPVPGDEIIGFVTKGRGVSVHRADCPNIKQDVDSDRFIEVYWDTKDTTSYPADIQIRTRDRSGLLAEITTKISELEYTILSVNTRVSKDSTILINIRIEINGVEELEMILEELKKINSVIDAYRVIV